MKHVFQHNPCRVTELVSAINPATCERTRGEGRQEEGSWDPQVPDGGRAVAHKEQGKTRSIGVRTSQGNLSLDKQQ